MKLTGRGRVPEKGNTVFIFLSWETLRALSHTYRDSQANTYTRARIQLSSLCLLVSFTYLKELASQFFRTCVERSQRGVYRNFVRLINHT